MGPYAHFGIVDDFDEHKDYGTFKDEEVHSFEDCLQKYHCIAIPDEIINDWWDKLMTMKSYHEHYACPKTAFARWGTTLIPPDSLGLFSEIIESCTSKKYLKLCQAELANLIILLKKAKCDNKFVIHYGV